MLTSQLIRSYARDGRGDAAAAADNLFIDDGEYYGWQGWEVQKIGCSMEHATVL